MIGTDTIRNCPHCGTELGITADSCWRCQKGVLDPTSVADRKAAGLQSQIKSENVANESILGGLILLIGLCMAAYFFVLFDASVPTGQAGERVMNLGQMHFQQNGLLFGIGVAIIGAILLRRK
jgi:hypothetical protein